MLPGNTQDPRSNGLKGKGTLIKYLRNDKNIISSISVTDIVFDYYLGKSNYRAVPKVKT